MNNIFPSISQPFFYEKRLEFSKSHYGTVYIKHIADKRGAVKAQLNLNLMYQHTMSSHSKMEPG